KYLKRILPVMLLDGCFNRDPNLIINEKFNMGAICGRCPMTLQNRDPKWKGEWAALRKLEGEEFNKAADALEATSRWDLNEIVEYKLSDKAVIGRSDEQGYFIADLRDGRLHLFPGRGERDWMLREKYHLDPETSFHAPSQWMWMRSRLFWPWVELYYLCCLLVIPWRQVGTRSLAAKKLYELPSL
ncbi:MAG: hypothetical protein ABL974_22990, partial [Prosthecobacter sp.]